VAAGACRLAAGPDTTPAVETSMDVHTWRQHRAEAEARWLKFLASTGYQLADIEQQVIDNVYPPDAPDDHQGDESTEPTGPARADGARASAPTSATSIQTTSTGRHRCT
jgi:hypothetical protein